MPSTLTHVALQTPFFVGVFGRTAWPWALLGCALPDVGWILQRAFKGFWRGEQEIFYDVRLAAVAWSSLLATLVLSCAVAVWARRVGRALLLLGLGALIHLALDASQLRWGNGVHFALPLHWEAWAPGFVPPDHGLSHALALVGLGGLALRARPSSWNEELVVDGRRALTSLSLLALYLVLPLSLQGGLAAADVHSIQTLRSAGRTGREVELYRAHYFPARDGESAHVLTLVSEPLEVAAGFELRERARVSMRARFVSERSIEVVEAHVHPNSRRSTLSIAGLAIVFGLLVRWVSGELARIRDSPVTGD
ncbi:MAG: hypothetical protein AAF690_06060 [Acidobacteriota bacterium]